MHFTRSESLWKASWQALLKCSARGSSSFHLHLGSSLGWDMGSPSPKGSNSTSHSGKCCCLALVDCIVVEDLLGWKGEGMGSLKLIVSCGAAIRRPVRDMFPVNKCMGYISTWALETLSQDWGVHLLRHLHILATSFLVCFPPDHLAELKCNCFYGRLPK